MAVNLTKYKMSVKDKVPHAKFEWQKRCQSARAATQYAGNSAAPFVAQQLAEAAGRAVAWSARSDMVFATE